MSKLDEMRSLGPSGAARQYIPAGGRVATEAEIAALRQTITKLAVTKLVGKKHAGGRPRVHASDAEKARRYRQRKKAAK
jgi:hypothetical protein